jgi:hypothetical protein
MNEFKIGWVQTDMGNSIGEAPLTVDQSVDGILQVLLTANRVQLGESTAEISKSLTGMADFADKFRKEQCVYVQYDGKLMPW